MRLGVAGLPMWRGGGGKSSSKMEGPNWALVNHDSDPTSAPCFLDSLE